MDSRPLRPVVEDQYAEPMGQERADVFCYLLGPDISKHDEYCKLVPYRRAPSGNGNGVFTRNPES